ncbi:hypothetical protein FB467_1614 [Ornithinicoccus hortensis]|uniref:Uncharacterized protein n=1 Tax=Ornithinicoccus hortensis TaxID=82346 RepID=A0A542YQY6_9MICO|nr:hypothetical protein FB467_1614 [Ornithinicoccus hortensis]
MHCLSTVTDESTGEDRQQDLGPALQRDGSLATW